MITMMSLSVCYCAVVENNTSELYQFLVHVAYDHESVVVVERRCNTFCVFAILKSTSSCVCRNCGNSIISIMFSNCSQSRRIACSVVIVTSRMNDVTYLVKPNEHSIPPVLLQIIFRRHAASFCSLQKSLQISASFCSI